MAFNGINFIFNNIPSEEFGLVITSLNDGETENSNGGDVVLTTDKTLKNPKNIILGVEQSPVLTFPIEFSSQRPLDALDVSRINTWLFGHLGYKELRIIQDDMYGIFFSCYLKNPRKVAISNNNYSFRCDVECDAPWGWEHKRTLVKSFPTTQYNKFMFVNTSDNLDDMFPIIEFTLTDNNYNFSLINHSYNNLEFKWTGLLGGETITVDNEHQFISSSTKLRRLDKFNKNFMKFKHGKNDLECIGTVKSLKITYQNAKKIGG